MNQPLSQPVASGRDPQAAKPPVGEDARQLLKTGAWLLAAGTLCLVLIETVFGGITEHGVHTNGAWLLLVAALSCLPLGIVLCLLGGAKWMGKQGR